MSTMRARRRLAGARVELWVEPRAGRPAVNAVMRALLGRLAMDGALLLVRVPEHEVAEAPGGPAPTPRADLVLLKTATALSLARAVADERAGARFLNRADATVVAADKAAALARLAAAGLPVPPTWLVAPGASLPSELAAGRGGFVAKPVRGLHGAGVACADGAVGALGASRSAPTAEWVVDDATRLLQPRIGTPDAPDLKVYVAGDQLFAAEKRWSATSYLADADRTVDLDAPTADLVMRAGAALGLRCFGVDLRHHDGEPVIIDINAFPGFRGFPQAAQAIAALVTDELRVPTR